jgi:hypothetical protein
MTIRAHFDGRVFVPDEPVLLPVGHPLVLLVSTNGDTTPSALPKRSIEEKLAAAERFSGSVRAGTLPEHTSRADNFYDERE